MTFPIRSIDYTTTLPSGSSWSLRLNRGTILKLTDLSGGMNIGMLFYNPDNLLERYNAPDTLKCQHTFKLSQGHCLYSDMGRIFASIVQDNYGWHDTVMGNANANLVSSRWGARDYQNHRNNWHQNGLDAFLVELAKYGLSEADLAANINWFSKVSVNDTGDCELIDSQNSQAKSVTLRIEMNTLCVLHTCPHPLNLSPSYPSGEVKLELGIAEAITADDECKNACPENQRGFENNALYHLGLEA